MTQDFTADGNQAARMADLARAAGRLTGRLELDQVIQAIAEETARILDVPMVAITLYDSEQDAMIFRGGYGLPPSVAQKVQSVPGEFYRRLSGELNATYLTPDARTMQGAPNQELFRQLNARTIVSVPLTRDETLVGRLLLCTVAETRHFTADEMQLLDVLVAQGAVAIQNAQLYSQVSAGRQQLRWLNQQVIAAQEVERQRLSRELHDSVGQMLTALAINLSLLAEDTPIENNQMRQDLTEAAGLSLEALEQIRTLAKDLRPVGLQNTGLNAVLEAFCQEFSRQTRLPITYSGIELPNLDEVVGVSFYRFLQEGLTNIAKHAQATQSNVQLVLQDNHITLTVADDGKGIPAAGDTASRPAGVGLLGLRERFDLLGGDVKIESTPGRGTRLMARLKLSPG